MRRGAGANDWQAKIPENKWPLFQGHKPVAPPTDGPVRYWLYSFPANFRDVVSLARVDLAKLGCAENPSREHRHVDIVFSKGGFVFESMAVMDDSYTITRNKRVSMLHPKKDPWDRMESAKGWVMVVRAETAGGHLSRLRDSAGLRPKG